MKAGFRGWLYRWVSSQFGLLGMLVFLTTAEISRFYGFSSWAAVSWVGLGLSFLLFMTAFFGEWIWKRYLIASFCVAAAFSLVYLALRPEMIRDDILTQLRTPPLSVDLVIYRTIILRNDPERALKIERLGFLYGFLRSYDGRVGTDTSTQIPALTPEVK